MSTIVTLLRKQRLLELSHVEALEPTIHSINDKLISALLTSIIHDSQKHATLLQALVDVESGKVKPKINIDNAIEMAQAVEEHVKVEADMIDRLKSLLESTEDNRIKSVLNYILLDERRHHGMLKRFFDLLIQEDLRYEKYFDLDLFRRQT
jgi:rubrerythrin